MTDAIKIEGLKEFRENLKVIDSDLPKLIRVANNRAANLVVDEAKPRVPSLTGKAARSIRAASTQKATRVAGGSARVPYYAWLDFGGTAGRVRRAWKGKKGRYIYAAYFKQRDGGDYIRVQEEALIDIVRQAGIGID